MRSAGRMLTVGSAVLAFLFVSLLCGAAVASDVERQFPLLRDDAGSGLTLEISREGTRSTATPFLTLSDPTARRFEDRIAKAIVRLEAQVVPAGESVADSIPWLAPAGTPREGTGRPQTSLSSLPPLPGEITIRNVRNFLKGLRASRKEPPVPAGIAAFPERRLGMAGTSPLGTN